MKYWDKSWSIISGCTPVSPACENCWLAQMDRFNCDKNYNCADCSKYEAYATLENPIEPCPCFARRNFSTGRIEFTGAIQTHPERLELPLKTKKPTTWAVWSDLFHEKVPADFITYAFEVMEYCKQHTFLVCTKRPERIDPVLYGQEGNWYLGGGDYIPNVFLGTTVENQEMADKRIPELLKCNPFKLFLSVEPLLSDINILRPLSIIRNEKLLHCICGCESGHHARETKPEWIHDLRDQCISASIPLWIKQVKISGKMVYDHPLSTIKREDLWK